MNALGKAIGLILLSLVGLSMLTTFLFSRPNNPLSFYDILGLDTVQSSNKEIKATYRHLIKRLHPDHRRHLSQEEQKKTERFSLDEINQAYNVLSNPQKRIRYDFSLANAGNFHYDTYSKSQFDKVQRTYDYSPNWDTPQAQKQLFGNIDHILLSYEMKYPQYAKYSREIYQNPNKNDKNDKNNDENDIISTIDIKPYILIRSKGYDNVITYHFSDWKDQLDKPRQNLINFGTILFSLVCAIVPIWFVCGSGSGSKDTIDDSINNDIVLDENGNAVIMTLEEYQKAGWTEESIKKHQKALKEKAEIQRYNKALELDEKERIKELNKINKERQEEKRRDTIIALAKKKNAEKNSYKLNYPGSQQQQNQGGTTPTPSPNSSINLTDTAQKTGDDDGKDKKNEKTQNVGAAGGQSGGNNQFHCHLCQKGYQSEAQFQQHIASNKHIKMMKDIEKKKK